MIFAPHVSGKKVASQRVLNTCSFFLKALMSAYFQDVHKPQPRNLSSLYLALSKLFRFRVEEEIATQSELVPFLFEEGGTAPTHM